MVIIDLLSLSLPLYLFLFLLLFLVPRALFEQLYVTFTWLRIPILFIMFLIVSLCTVFPWLSCVLHYTGFIISSALVNLTSVQAPLLSPLCKYCVEYWMVLWLCGNHQAWFRKFTRRPDYWVHLQAWFSLLFLLPSAPWFPLLPCRFWWQDFLQSFFKPRSTSNTQISSSLSVFTSL